MSSVSTLGKRKLIGGYGEELRKINYYQHNKLFTFFQILLLLLSSSERNSPHTTIQPCSKSTFSRNFQYKLLLYRHNLNTETGTWVNTKCQKIFKISSDLLKDLLSLLIIKTDRKNNFLIVLCYKLMPTLVCHERELSPLMPNSQILKATCHNFSLFSQYKA